MIDLVVDIGNTETAAGLYEAVRARRTRSARHSFVTAARRLSTFRLPTADRLTADLLASLVLPHLGRRAIGRLVIASVVPSAEDSWSEFAVKHLGAKPLVLESSRVPGIALEIERPSEAGIDRVVNAWMGFRRYGGPLVVVDMGTATTFDVVSATGAYLGGAIAPGPALQMESLARRTARLPRIDLHAPPRIIGRNTIEALRSGVVGGHAAMVEGLLEGIRKEMPGIRAVATGGLMGTVRPALEKRFEAFDAYLTLDGAAEIAGIYEV